MKIKELPKHLRPREKLIEKGAASLKDSELLAIILRTGKAGKNAIELSKYILAKYPMKTLLDLDFSLLVKIEGIDSGKACGLLASFELVKRAWGKYDNNLPTVDSPQDVVDQLTEIRNKKKEYFVAIYLNARNQIIFKEIITIGTLNASIVHPREVFAPAIKHGAAALIIAHNHPSGDPKPSDQDLKMTKRLSEAGKILAVELADHIVLSEDSFVSMKSEKLM